MFAWIAYMFVGRCGFVPKPHHTAGFLHLQGVILPSAKTALDGALNTWMAFNIQHTGIRKLAQHHMMLLSIFKYRRALNMDLIEHIETRTSINQTRFIEIYHNEPKWTLCFRSWNVEPRLLLCCDRINPNRSKFWSLYHWNRRIAERFLKELAACMCMVFLCMCNQFMSECTWIHLDERAHLYR